MSKSFSVLLNKTITCNILIKHCKNLLKSEKAQNLRKNFVFLKPFWLSEIPLYTYFIYIYFKVCEYDLFIFQNDNLVLFAYVTNTGKKYFLILIPIFLTQDCIQ